MLYHGTKAELMPAVLLKGLTSSRYNVGYATLTTDKVYAESYAKLSLNRPPQYQRPGVLLRISIPRAEMSRFIESIHSQLEPKAPVTMYGLKMPIPAKYIKKAKVFVPASASSHPEAQSPPRIRKKGTNPHVEIPYSEPPAWEPTTKHGKTEAQLQAEYQRKRLLRHPELATGAPHEKLAREKKPASTRSKPSLRVMKNVIKANGEGVTASLTIPNIAEWNTNTVGIIKRPPGIKFKIEDWESKLKRKYQGHGLIPSKADLIHFKSKVQGSVHIAGFGEKPEPPKKKKETKIRIRGIKPRTIPQSMQGYTTIHKTDKYGRYFTIPMGRELGPDGTKYIHTFPSPRLYRRESGHNVMTTSQALSFLGTIEHAFTRNPVFGGLPYMAKTWPEPGEVGTLGGKNVRGVEQPASEMWEELKDDISDAVVQAILKKRLGLKNSKEWINSKQGMLDKGEPFIPAQFEEAFHGVPSSRKVNWSLSRKTSLKRVKSGHFRATYGKLLPMMIGGEKYARRSDTPLVWLGDLLNSIECWGTWETRELYYGVKTQRFHSAITNRWRLEEGKGVVKRDKRVTMVELATWMSHWAANQGPGFLRNPAIVHDIKIIVHAKVMEFILSAEQGYRQTYLYEVTQAGKRKG